MSLEDDTSKDAAQAPAPEPPRATSNADEFWSLAGLQIARKTEIIALAAFVLSISGVLWQLFSYARGASVTLFPSDQIVITSMEKLGRNYADQANYLAVIATMSYVNQGDAGHNAIVRREAVRFTLNGRQIEHRWYEFGSSDIKDGQLAFDRKGEARPFPVNAGSAQGHETLVAAWLVDCDKAPAGCDEGANFVKWDDFIAALQTSRELSFTTRADIYEASPVSATCVVRLRDWEIKKLVADKWLAVVCSDAPAGAPSQRPAQRTAAPAQP